MARRWCCLCRPTRIQSPARTAGEYGPATGGATTGGTTAAPAPTSLTSGASYSAYATAAQTVKQNWGTYADADARGKALGQAAITALTSVTSDLIESTSQQLRTQGAAINEQAAASTINIAKLQAAFEKIRTPGKNLVRNGLAQVVGRAAK